MSEPKIVITTTDKAPKVIRKRTEAVVISPKNTLYDANAQLDEPVVVMTKVEPEVMTTTAVEEPKQEEQVLYSTDAEKAADFSWQKEEAPPPEQPLDELLKKAEPEAREYVAVTTATSEPPRDNNNLKISDWAILFFFAFALFVGGKAFFDYTQEFTSFKRIANQLEQESPPPKINLRNFVDEEADDAASITKRNAFRAKAKVNPDTVGLAEDGWIEVIKTKPYYLLAKRKDGKIELRTGGTVGWRLNNPGEFGYADFAKETGAFDKYSKYAIYPSMKKGMGAVEIYLFNTNLYQGLTINEAIKKFYSGDKEKAERVAKAISVALNISRYKTKMIALNETQKNKLLNVIKNEEMKLKGITRLYDNMEEFNKKGF